MSTLQAAVNSLRQLFFSCEIDYQALKEVKITEEWFSDYNNQRIVNSFLFNYIKIQDKMGAKLLKSFLHDLREINELSISMVDVLHRLEKLEILDSIDTWDRLREIRNLITHEYPADIEERVENINLALNGYEIMKKLFDSVRVYQWGSVLNSAQFNHRSDIDIALEGVTDAEDFFALWGEAEKLTHFSLDIVQLEKIEPEYAALIKRKGKLVYEQN